MSISSISPTTPMPTPPKAAAVEAAEATRGGKEVRNDGDSDDRGGAAMAARPPQPTTNALGQTIGQHVNVTA